MDNDQDKGAVQTPQHCLEGLYKCTDGCSIRSLSFVSLTSAICKVMKFVMKHSGMNHFIGIAVLSDAQFGSVSKHPYLTNLITEQWKTWFMGACEPVDDAFLDFIRSYDSVNHRSLFIKSAAYGVYLEIIECSWVFMMLSTFPLIQAALLPRIGYLDPFAFRKQTTKRGPIHRR